MSDTFQLPDTWRDDLVDCDFVAVSGLVHEMLRLQNEIARSKGGSLYFEPEFVGLVEAFVTKPNLETASAFLGRYPSETLWEAFVEGCLPDSVLSPLHKFREQIKAARK